MIAHNPPDIRRPFAQYSHAIEVTAPERLLVISGQLGITLDDRIPDGAEAQARLIFENLDTLLAAGCMMRRNILRLNAYVTGREHMAGYMAARDLWVKDLDPPPASTLMIVSGFTRPEFLVEIEALAAA